VVDGAEKRLKLPPILGASLGTNEALGIVDRSYLGSPNKLEGAGGAAAIPPLAIAELSTFGKSPAEGIVLGIGTLIFGAKRESWLDDGVDKGVCFFSSYTGLNS